MAAALTGPWQVGIPFFSRHSEWHSMQLLFSSTSLCSLQRRTGASVIDTTLGIWYGIWFLSSGWFPPMTWDQRPHTATSWLTVNSTEPLTPAAGYRRPRSAPLCWSVYRRRTWWDLDPSSHHRYTPSHRFGSVVLCEAEKRILLVSQMFPKLSTDELDTHPETNRRRREERCL